MRKSLLFVLFINCSISYQFVYSQGWVAEVEININHGMYAYERITNASVTISGVTVSGSSTTRILRLVLKGAGSPSGNIYIQANGVAWEPYVRTDPFNASIYATYTGAYSANCTLSYYDSYDGTNLQHISGSVKIYPRLAISNFVQQCDNLTLTSNTCSSSFIWEVSESASGTYKFISGKLSSSISVTPEELYALGLSSKYGRKYFRVTGLSGTTSQIQVVDIYYPGPTASITASSPKCHDGVDGSIKVDIISPYPSGIDDYVITLFKDVPPANQLAQDYVNNGSVITFSDLTAGNYWIRIQNNSSISTYGSCWTDYAVDPLINPAEVTIPFQISDYNGYAIKCKGGSDGTLQANPSGGTGVYSTYVWTPNVSSTNVAVNLSENTYKVKVKDSNDCWSDEYNQTLTAPEKLTLGLVSTGGKGGFDVSCLDKTDGVIVTTVSGGIPEYSYGWSNGSTTSTLTGIGTGKYNVTVTDVNGCTNVESLNLSAPMAIDFTIMEISEVKCPGDHSGAFEVQSMLNTIGQIYYSWSSGESGKEITNKAAGTYSVTVSDEQRCSTTKSKTLVEPLSYSVDIITASDYNGSAISCNGEENGKLATLVRDGDNNITTAEYYTWYKNGNEFVAGASHVSLDQLTAGFYKVEIEYRNICKVEKTFVLNEPDPVLPLISNVSNYNGLPISCYGESDGRIKATANGGTGNTYTYTWQNGETSADLSNLSAGTYFVTARDVNGCEGTAEKILDDPEPVNPSISVLSNFSGQPLSCYDASDGRLKASANGGAGTFTYTWNTGQIGSDLIDIKAGNYTLTATDQNGCISTTDTTILNPVPVKAVISDVFNYNNYGVRCKGSHDGYIATEGTGGTGIYEFTWQGTSYSDSLYANLPAGSYTVTVTDQNGCSDTNQTIITEPAILNLSVLDVKNVACNNGNDGELQLLATGGAGDYEYSTDDLIWQSPSALTGLNARTYQIGVRDVNGCKQTITQILTQPAELSISFENVEPAFCGDPRGKATAIVNGGTGNYRYQWTDSQNNVFSNEANITDQSSGLYTLTVFDDNNCEVIKSVGITSVDGPKVSISNIVSATCSYSSDGSALLEITDGNGSFSFRWPDGQSTTEGINLAQGDYLVEITDNNNCTVVETVRITAPDSLDISLVESIEPACNGDCNGKLKVMAKGGTENYSYQWTNFIGSELSNLCAGNYEVKVADENGCISEKSFSLSQPKPIDVRLLLAQSPTCHDGCDGRLEVEASGGTGELQYEWSTGANDSDINELCAGSYSTMVTDINNCTITETYILENPAGNSLDLGGSITLCTGQTHMLDPGSYWESYSWASNTGFTNSSQRVTIKDAGMYWLEAVNNKGCMVQDTFLLETALDLLKANFLLTTEAMTGDTVVMIDISWPLPEHAIWNFPVEMKRLEDFGDIVYGQFENTGKYEVSLTATLGECRDQITKSITILDGEEDIEEGRLGHESFVKEFNLYPVPNDGMFDVAIELLEESPIMLTVWNTLTAKKIGTVQDTGRKSYLKHIDLKPLSAGPYTLRLDYVKGTKYIRFIVR